MHARLLFEKSSLLAAGPLPETVLIHDVRADRDRVIDLHPRVQVGDRAAVAVEGRGEQQFRVGGLIPPQQRGGPGRVAVVEAAQRDRPAGIPDRVGFEDGRIQGGPLRRRDVLQGSRDGARIPSEYDRVDPRVEHLDRIRRAALGKTPRPAFVLPADGFGQVFEEVRAVFGGDHVLLCHRAGHRGERQDHGVAVWGAVRREVLHGVLVAQDVNDFPAVRAHLRGVQDGVRQPRLRQADAHGPSPPYRSPPPAGALALAVK
jgi:hypothetical protein